MLLTRFGDSVLDKEGNEEMCSSSEDLGIVKVAWVIFQDLFCLCVCVELCEWMPPVCVSDQGSQRYQIPWS